MKASVHIKKGLINVLVFFVLLIWLFGSVSTFMVNTNNQVVASFEDVVQSVAQNNTNAVDSTFNKYTHFLMMTADFLRNVPYDEAYFEVVLNEIVELEDFSNIAIVLPNGTSYVTNGEALMLANYEFSEQMQNEETFVSDIQYDTYLKSDVVTVNVPLLNDEEELMAYIVGVLTTNILSEYFNKTFYDVGGYYHVIDSNGRYAAMSDSDMMIHMDVSFWEAVEELNYVDGYNAMLLTDTIKQKESGFSRYYGEDGSERTAYYMPIPINDWVMYSVIPQEVIEARVTSTLNSTIVLVINIVLIFFVLLIWVYHSQRALAKYAQESEKNLRLVAEQTNKFIIEWDFIHERVKLTGNFQSLFNKNRHVLYFSMETFSKRIHKDDIKVLENALLTLKNGTQVDDIKARMMRENKSYIWCAFSGVPIKSSKKNNMFERALGFMENIDEKEREAVLLKEMSELDTLTNIYNKGTTEKLIKRIISNSEESQDEHSLLIIDLDNFKSLNDTFGHQFGDEVIKELANYLTSIIRHNDIVGRIGGDEFFVFMKDSVSDQLVEEKCENICNHFHKAYEKDHKSVTISASIGVASYPAHGTSFSQLYQNADIALYHVKQAGKNNYQFYDGRRDIDYVSQRTKIDSLGEGNDRIQE